jgi:hypothetical protein
MSAVIIYLLGERLDKAFRASEVKIPDRTKFPIGAMAGLFYAFYPSSIVFSSVLTCQHLASLLFYLSFLVLSGNKNKAWRFAACGLLIGFGQIIRPVAPPFLLAVFVFYILRVWTERNRDGEDGYTGYRDKARKTLAVFITLACYLSVTVLFSLILYREGLTDAPFASGDMRYKFIVGLDLNSNGGYSQEYADLFLGGGEEEKQEIFKNTIDKIIKSPIETILLFNRKINEIFVKPDSTMYYLTGLRMYDMEKSGDTESLEYKNYSNSDKIFKNADYLYCLVIYLFASTGLFALRRVNFPLSRILALTMLFYVGTHLLIEVQPRYRYEIMPALFIFAAYGVRRVFWDKLNRNPD